MYAPFLVFKNGTEGLGTGTLHRCKVPRLGPVYGSGPVVQGFAEVMHLTYASMLRVLGKKGNTHILVGYVVFWWATQYFGGLCSILVGYVGMAAAQSR
jgi:hypothetical protein